MPVVVASSRTLFCGRVMQRRKIRLHRMQDEDLSVWMEHASDRGDSRVSQTGEATL